MSEILQKGTTIPVLYSEPLTIEAYLGGGGQGDVYRVKYNGQDRALKWYKKGAISDPRMFYDNLKENVNRGTPNEAFLWPIALTEWVDGTFGYVMELKPDGYYEMTEFVLKNVCFPTFKRAIDAALNIVLAFRILHNQGYSYQDLNDGNFFINPRNGDVLICDNDNVAPNGVQTGILGKPRYMAPEIVMRKSMPNTQSDRHSMAVIIFMLLCLNHPLEGKRSIGPVLTPEKQELLFGAMATFMMDPENNDNGPDLKIHSNAVLIWDCLPDYMRDIFEKAFSHKALLENPNSRPVEIDWIEVLVRFRSDIAQCSCGNEVFVSQGKTKTCEKCGKEPYVPVYLELPDYSIPGMADTRIFKCQTCFCDAEEALSPIARVVVSKDDPQKLGLKNASDQIWNAVTSKGKERKVQPKEVIPMKPGIRFTCNNSEIKITKNA